VGVEQSRSVARLLRSPDLAMQGERVTTESVPQSIRFARDPYPLAQINKMLLPCDLVHAAHFASFYPTEGLQPRRQVWNDLNKPPLTRFALVRCDLDMIFHPPHV
jgi:hypothetical protein